METAVWGGTAGRRGLREASLPLRLHPPAFPPPASFEAVVLFLIFIGTVVEIIIVLVA